MKIDWTSLEWKNKIWWMIIEMLRRLLKLLNYLKSIQNRSRKWYRARMLILVMMKLLKIKYYFYLSCSSTFTHLKVKNHCIVDLRKKCHLTILTLKTLSHKKDILPLNLTTILLPIIEAINKGKTKKLQRNNFSNVKSYK